MLRYYPHSDSKFHYMKLLSVRCDMVSSGYDYVCVRVIFVTVALSNCHTLEVPSDYYDILVLVAVSVLVRCLYGCHRLEEV